MSRQGDFMVYCTEQYKSAKKLSGKQVSELFSRYQVWDYIYSCFEALHTTGANYIVDDIDLYIKAECICLNGVKYKLLIQRLRTYQAVGPFLSGVNYAETFHFSRHPRSSVLSLCKNNTKVMT